MRSAKFLLEFLQKASIFPQPDAYVFGYITSVDQLSVFIFSVQEIWYVFYDSGYRIVFFYNLSVLIMFQTLFKRGHVGFFYQRYVDRFSYLYTFTSLRFRRIPKINDRSSFFFPNIISYTRYSGIIMEKMKP